MKPHEEDEEDWYDGQLNLRITGIFYYELRVKFTYNWNVKSALPLILLQQKNVETFVATFLLNLKQGFGRNYKS